MQKLSIKLKTFDFIKLEKSINFIKQIALDYNISTIKFFSFPLSRTIYTLERSPHIDKKSREQFELKSYKAELFITLDNIKKVSTLIYVLKNSLFPGVELQISIEYFDFLDKIG